MERRQQRRAAAPVSQGIGESKIFGGGDPVDETRLADENCTINGKPIPSHLVHAVPYYLTDQGVAENDGKSKASCSVSNDNFDKIQQYNQTVSEPWMMVDAVGALKPHLTPGFQGRMLSPTAVDRKGLRGWQPVKNDKGDLVKVGRMFLGEMPIDVAKRRNAHYREQSADAVRQKQEEVIAGLDDIASRAGDGSLGAMRRGEVITDSETGERIEIGSFGSRGSAPTEELVGA